MYTDDVSGYLHHQVCDPNIAENYTVQTRLLYFCLIQTEILVVENNYSSTFSHRGKKYPVRFIIYNFSESRDCFEPFETCK